MATKLPKNVLPAVSPDNNGFFEPRRGDEPSESDEREGPPSLEAALQALFPPPRIFTDPKRYVLMEPAPPLDPVRASSFPFSRRTTEILYTE